MKNFLRTMLILFGATAVIMVSAMLLIIAGKITLSSIAIGLGYILTHKIIKMLQFLCAS